MAQTSKTGGSLGSVTLSTALLNQKHATLSAPRMLTPSEIASLRQGRKEADIVIRNYFEGINVADQVDLAS